MRTRLLTTDSNPRENPPYALCRGLGFWEVAFEGRAAIFRDEVGAPYIAWLLLHPPRKPIHALALALEARSFSGRTPRAADAVLHRYLGLDEAEAVRNLRRRERELEAVLDDDEAIEAVKAEALRELAAIADFMRTHPWRSRECVQKCAREVRLAIRCLHARLAVAVDAEGKPDTVLRAFAGHLDEYLLIPSDGGGIPGRFRLGAALPGWFTYEPPRGVVWEGGAERWESKVLSLAPGVEEAQSRVQSPESRVQSAESRVLSLTSKVGGAESRVQGSESKVQSRADLSMAACGGGGVLGAVVVRWDGAGAAGDRLHGASALEGWLGGHDTQAGWGFRADAGAIGESGPGDEAGPGERQGAELHGAGGLTGGGILECGVRSGECRRPKGGSAKCQRSTFNLRRGQSPSINSQLSTLNQLRAKRSHAGGGAGGNPRPDGAKG